MIWAVVPAKLGKHSKERLAPELPAPVRERLSRAMLVDVLAATRKAAGIARTLVVSGDPAARALSRDAGAEFLPESGAGGLNASVEQALGHCVAAGAHGVVIAMGDLPLLRPEDIDEALAALPGTGAVLVPSADGTGTNLVAARPVDVLRPCFGPGSLARHLAQETRSFSLVVRRCAGAALDVDTPDDLAQLRSLVDPHTASGLLLRDPAAAPRVTVGA